MRNFLNLATELEYTSTPGLSVRGCAMELLGATLGVTNSTDFILYSQECLRHLSHKKFFFIIIKMIKIILLIPVLDSIFLKNATPSQINKFFLENIFCIVTQNILYK